MRRSRQDIDDAMADAAGEMLLGDSDGVSAFADDVDCLVGLNDGLGYRTFTREELNVAREFNNRQILLFGNCQGCGVEFERMATWRAYIENTVSARCDECSREKRIVSGRKAGRARAWRFDMGQIRQLAKSRQPDEEDAS